LATATDILHQPLAFVDIETTGGSYRYARVLEIGVIRVEGGRVVGEMRQLINPGTPVPRAITELTGITTDDVADAPSFEEISLELAELLDGAVFVAHNVHFDYNFIKMEFEQLERPFAPRLLCTVKLSRRLWPGERGHSLQAIIQRFNFETAARHRAYDDALVLWQFYRLIMAEFDLDTVETAVAAQFKSPSLPSHLDQQLIANLPTGPGVYIFEDADGAPLYVGKSVGIRARVRSHFANFHSSSTELKISTAIRHVRAVPTHGELSALLTEARLIKELQPLHNKQLRRRERLTLAVRHRNAAGYYGLELRDGAAIDPAEADIVMAVYPTTGRARGSLHTLARNFYLCPKLMSLEKARGACFQVQLGKCRGACCDQEDPADYNARFTSAFEHSRLVAWPYPGPILVTERHSQLEGAEGIIIDQWRLLGRLRQLDDGTVEETSLQYDFDLDMYKILRAYLQDPRRRPQVQRYIPATQPLY
jgi:DNA polymerase-3 subunit epsilon